MGDWDAGSYIGGLKLVPRSHWTHHKSPLKGWLKKKGNKGIHLIFWKEHFELVQDKNFFSMRCGSWLGRGKFGGFRRNILCFQVTRYRIFSKQWAHLWPRHTYDLGPMINQDIELAATDAIHHLNTTEETLLIFSPDGVTELEIHEEQLSQAKGWLMLHHFKNSDSEKDVFFLNDIWVMVSTRKPLQMFCFPPTEKRFRQGEGNASRLQSRSSLLKCWDSSVREERGAATKTVLGNMWTTPETFREDAF